MSKSDVVILGNILDSEEMHFVEYLLRSNSDNNAAVKYLENRLLNLSRIVYKNVNIQQGGSDYCVIYCLRASEGSYGTMYGEQYYLEGNHAFFHTDSDISIANSAGTVILRLCYKNL